MRLTSICGTLVAQKAVAVVSGSYIIPRATSTSTIAAGTCPLSIDPRCRSIPSALGRSPRGSTHGTATHKALLNTLTSQSRPVRLKPHTMFLSGRWKRTATIKAYLRIIVHFSPIQYGVAILCCTFRRPNRLVIVCQSGIDMVVSTFVQSC
ncbi:hypothetical protein K461DRAFT_54639 [Myriangium duriaei CBS 260.36]|uniref:Uncharacterized protein n=1 Tax=Myriangium duriaei CBS 260.36 TaxID=1168546 RepID=A0A9P4IY55_9PEZI|nr:hypothetical protein K461DRAFT_54639 [Myriangium duriaei CBS 260.36]